MLTELNNHKTSFFICPKDSCTGCTACMNVCSHAAISFIPDEEGFLHPSVDKGRCVNCGLCKSVCPVNTPVSRYLPEEVYSGWSNDGQVRLCSSSGGAFSAIAISILNQRGIVFGCTLNADLEAVHVGIERVEDLYRLQGSKYVQSRVEDSYKLAKQNLKTGRKVLFSGTPCQIAGLRSYLHKNYDNLCTVDIICHGVPSPKIFNDYKRHIAKKKRLRIENIQFRCKKSSWIFYSISVYGHTEKGSARVEYIGNYYNDPYIRGFLRDNFLRPSCYSCQYCNIRRCSDFTIADWWGYQAEPGELSDFEKKGVSLIMCNSAKAVDMFTEIKQSMVLRQRTIEEAKRTNLSLSRPFAKPCTRDLFWKDYKTLSFDTMVSKYMYPERLTPSVYIWAKLPNTKIRRFLITFFVRCENLLRKLKCSFLIPHIHY